MDHLDMGTFLSPASSFDIIIIVELASSLICLQLRSSPSPPLSSTRPPINFCCPLLRTARRSTPTSNSSTNSTWSLWATTSPKRRKTVSLWAKIWCWWMYLSTYQDQPQHRGQVHLWEFSVGFRGYLQHSHQGLRQLLLEGCPGWASDRTR